MTTMTSCGVSCLTIGLDVGDKKTQLCELRDRTVFVNKTITTSRAALSAEFANRPTSHVVLEVGSQSPWMSELLRALGHTVRVVDARRVAKMCKGNRKTDQRDAESLARLASGVPEMLGEVSHRPPEAYADMAVLRARDVLVRTRTRLINCIRGVLKTVAIRLPSFSAPSFSKKARCLVPTSLQPALSPLLDSLDTLEKQIRSFDSQIEAIATARHPVAAKLRQVQGVGSLTSLAFVLTVFDPHRFRKSRTVGSWVGLAPKKRESGDSNPQLSITREGNSFLRRLLVNAAQYILGPFAKNCALRQFGLRLCERGGKNAKKRAVVAVARKLAVLLHRLWVSDQPYDSARGMTAA